MWHHLVSHLASRGKRKKKITYIFWWCLLKKEILFFLSGMTSFSIIIIKISLRQTMIFIYDAKGIAKLKNSFCAYLTPTAITRAISSWTFSTTRLLLSSSNVSQRYDERWKLEWESVESRKLISQASNVS